MLYFQVMDVKGNTYNFTNIIYQDELKRLIKAEVELFNDKELFAPSVDGYFQVTSMCFDDFNTVFVNTHLNQDNDNYYCAEEISSIITDYNDILLNKEKACLFVACGQYYNNVLDYIFALSHVEEDFLVVQADNDKNALKEFLKFNFYNEDVLEPLRALANDNDFINLINIDKVFSMCDIYKSDYIDNMYFAKIIY